MILHLVFNIRMPLIAQSDMLISLFNQASNVSGLLITLEGIDGSGKTTVLEMISSRLAKSVPMRRFIFTAEPTKGDAGKILRARLTDGTKESGDLLRVRKMEELLLFMADHSDHLASVIIPSLNDGAVVISDRYADSTAAYQGVTLRGIVPDSVKWIMDLRAPWDIVPDRTLLFAIDPAVAIERIRSRENMEKFERLDFLKEVDANFRRIAALDTDRFVIIDASRDIEEVAKDAFLAILNIL